MAAPEADRPATFSAAGGGWRFLAGTGASREAWGRDRGGNADCTVPKGMEAGPHVDAPHRRILVVDDDARSRSAVARILVDEGYDATVAQDGEEATALLTSWRPDLVLTDLHMPRVDGRGLLERVRKMLPGTPVIVLSARGTAEAIRLTAGMGASDVFPKPVHVDELLVRIRDLIGG
jgi:CheY-like chemotaxis protein